MCTLKALKVTGCTQVEYDVNTMASRMELVTLKYTFIKIITFSHLNKSVDPIYHFAKLNSYHEVAFVCTHRAESLALAVPL